MPRSEPASTLEEIDRIFDPTLQVDPGSPLYVPRTDLKLDMLRYDLRTCPGSLHAFLCGHRGSGKSTELRKLEAEPDITARYMPVYVTAREFGDDTVHLSHDALLVEIGRRFVEEGTLREIDCEGYREEIDEWGREVVKTFLRNEIAQAEAGAKGSAWLAFFKAQLATRREWKLEQKQVLEPKVQDLVAILNRLAQHLKNRTSKQVLAIVDDLEKGESDAHRDMHQRLFEEHYDVLVQPTFAIVYTLPIYFRALAGRRIQNDELYAFSAARLYDKDQKSKDRPAIETASEGYKLMRGFVERRVKDIDTLFGPGVLDELLLVGGGLFRETARALGLAAYFALRRKAQKIEAADAANAFNLVKKEYQPLLRGKAVSVLKAVLESRDGWVPDVEPYLQARAVVEYENDDIWLDVRCVLKDYVRGLSPPETPAATRARV